MNYNVALISGLEIARAGACNILALNVVEWCVIA